MVRSASGSDVTRLEGHMTKWKALLLLVPVVVLFDARPGLVEAANFGAERCIGAYCCRAQLFDGTAYTHLLFNNNVVSSSQYKVRERVTCNGTLHYSDLSTDNNCGSNCEIAQIAVPCGNPSSNVCNIYQQ